MIFFIFGPTYFLLTCSGIKHDFVQVQIKNSLIKGATVKNQSYMVEVSLESIFINVRLFFLFFNNTKCFKMNFGVLKCYNICYTKHRVINDASNERVTQTVLFIRTRALVRAMVPPPSVNKLQQQSWILVSRKRFFVFCSLKSRNLQLLCNLPSVLGSVVIPHV